MRDRLSNLIRCTTNDCVFSTTCLRYMNNKPRDDIVSEEYLGHYDYSKKCNIKTDYEFYILKISKY